LHDYRKIEDIYFDDFVILLNTKKLQQKKVKSQSTMSKNTAKDSSSVEF